MDVPHWTCVVRPEACAYMGYLKGQGLLIRLDCREQEPKRQFREDRDPVWKDSAMEFFLAFPVQRQGEGLSNEALYVNFEINANGVLFAQVGFGKKEREFVPERVYRECGCRAFIGPKGWTAELLVPEWYLKLLYPRWRESFFCNFYKISESPEIEHYLSYHPIDSDTPNFHLPLCFARVKWDEEEKR